MITLYYLFMDLTSKQRKMNKWKIACLSLLITSLILSFAILNQKTAYQLHYKTTINNYSEVMDTFGFYKLNHSLSYGMTGEKAKDVICQYNEEVRFLSKFLNKKPVLIFRYTDKICNSCVDEQISALKKHFFRENEKVVVLSSYQMESNFYMSQKAYNIRFPFCLIPSDAFDWVLEDSSNPYYFVLHPDMKISHIYVPDKAYPELNKQYLEGVKRFLSE